MGRAVDVFGRWAAVEAPFIPTPVTLGLAADVFATTAFEADFDF